MKKLSLLRTKKEVDNFVRFLSARGAEILSPTSEWEVVRFKGNSGVSIAYRDKSGKVTFTNETGAAYDAFVNGKVWRAIPKPRRTKLTPVIRTLLERDGDLCFFCGLKIQPGEESVDHLVEVTHGGPNHVSNYVLMHLMCNTGCAGMSATEKIRAHVEWKLHG